LDKIVWEVMQRHLPAICDDIAKALGKRVLGDAARGAPAAVRAAELPSAEALFRAAAQGGQTALARALVLPREQLIGIIGWSHARLSPRLPRR
jgi:hypothetical protein